MKRPYGMCPKCKQLKVLTRHHVYPKRFFGKIGRIEWLCRRCHDALEKVIPMYIPLPKRRYREILSDFLKGSFDESQTT